MFRAWRFWMKAWGLLPPETPQETPEPIEEYPEWKEIEPTVVEVDFVNKRIIRGGHD